MHHQDEAWGGSELGQPCRAQIPAAAGRAVCNRIPGTRVGVARLVAVGVRVAAIIRITVADYVAAGGGACRTAAQYRRGAAMADAARILMTEAVCAGKVGRCPGHRVVAAVLPAVGRLRPPGSRSLPLLNFRRSCRRGCAGRAVKAGGN